MAIITVSREYGSRGEQIVQQVAKGLGYSYFDKDILADVARVAKTTEEQIHPYDEKDEGSLRSFLREFFMPRSLIPAVDWPHYTSDLFIEWSLDPVGVEPILNADKVVSFFRHVVESLWARDDVVIVGRGSQRILAEKPNTLHLRFIAPIADRIDQVMAGEGVVYSQASKKIETIDKQRAHYLKHYYNADWADARLYHLVVNTSLMSVEQGAKVILTAVHHLENDTSGAPG